MKPYIDYNDALDPDANSYQGKLARKSKVLISEERQGHLNQMKKSYKSGYHEKELTVPLVKMSCPQSFINGPDTLNVGEAGVFHTRAVESFNSFDIQSVWQVSTPANMGYDQRIIDSIPPYTGKESTPKRYAKPSGERRWSKDDGLTKRWSSGGGDKKWSTDSGKKRWEGQIEPAEDTGTEEGFCRAEYRFNHSGMVRLDSTPVLPGVSPLLKSAPKYVWINSPSILRRWWDNFSDNSVDLSKWWGGNPFRPPFGGSGVYFDCNEQNFQVEFEGNDPAGGQVPHFHNRIHSRCPKSYLTSDFTISINFSNLVGWPCADPVAADNTDCIYAYLMLEYGSGSDDWYSIEFCYHCENTGSGQIQEVFNRWGYQEYGPEVDHFTYGNTRPASLPESGVLKMRRRGSQLQFWNNVDSQWESIAFPTVTEDTPIKIGVWACWADSALPHTVFYDNFFVQEE